ncbi:hypothetical protein H2198_005668 [Neophaeococcomyces mojaviensis]|uniref:Uncharacterized protein n=1 Tax=Neophaeococcomyces mojaviensis TaxID=3383035 RepID=A0ACC3A5B9_9EURO|nr:hypothetical protein H2198_005668 [Knufia sp. JES_112]
MAMQIRRKALLIGINYFGSQHELHGCVNDVQNVAAFLVSRGYSSSPKDMIFLTDERSGPYYPSGHNIIAAMDWLVSEPGCCLFLHYSGHGGQVPDQSGTRASGFNDTIVPVDFEQRGMIDSGILHRHLVSRLPQNSTLFIVFDCCHSGSAVELPYVYRTDEDGNVNLMDNLEAGMQLMGEASHLIQGGFSFNNFGEAAQLLGGAKDFFRGLQHQFSDDDNDTQNGLAAQSDFAEDWSREGKSVFMLSGCKDEQTSADAFIMGKHVGAMSWAFLETMKRDYQWNISYVQLLQNTRELLQQNYSQVPQLSCGYSFDLNRPFRV